MLYLGTNCYVADYFPYRTALVTNIFFQIKYNSSNEVICGFKKLLFEMVGKQQDNHCCFELSIKNSNMNLFIQFSDWTMFVGSDIYIEKGN